MSHPLSQVGTFLKQKREERHLSLQEVSHATSIRITHLQSIEEGKTTCFIASVYMLGSLQKYADFLEIDRQVLGAQYPEIHGIHPPSQEFAYGIGTLEKIGDTAGGVCWVPHFLWAVFSMTMLLFTYYCAQGCDIL